MPIPIRETEIEIYGEPIIIVYTEDTIGWKMKQAIAGERYGAYYKADVGLDYVIAQAERCLETFDIVT